MGDVITIVSDGEQNALQTLRKCANSCSKVLLVEPSLVPPLLKCIGACEALISLIPNIDAQGYELCGSSCRSCAEACSNAVGLEVAVCVNECIRTAAMCDEMAGLLRDKTSSAQAAS